MKVNVRVIFDKTDVIFEIPVGMGDKTFKWLGMVACNRFASSAPNGGLRRRDPARRGATDKAVHQPVEMALQDGQIPHPNALIYDFCRDNDEVKVHLIDTQVLGLSTGIPQKSQWADLAFSSKSAATDENGDSAVINQKLGGNSTGSSIVSTDVHTYGAQSQMARAQFMRILFKSQMPNPSAVTEKVSIIWKTVQKAMPGMTEEDEREIIDVVCGYWDMISEIFTYFARITRGTGGKLPQEGFYKILFEGKVFDETILDVSYARIFARACAAAENGDAQLSIGGLLVAFILITQTKYNDTYDADNEIHSPSLGLQDIFSNYLTQVAERMEMKSVLKETFVSTHVLNQVREWHDDLFAVFNKYAGRSRELPSSLSYKDMTDMLYDAGMTEASETDTKGYPISFEMTTAENLLTEVRQGTINGRKIIEPVIEGNSAEEDQSGLPDDVIPENEFTYPEMVEAICRHAFNRYRGTKPDEETGECDYLDYVGDLTIADCYVKGMVNVIGTIGGNKGSKK